MYGALREASACRTFRIALGVGLLVAVGLSLSPLFGTPGVESALALGVILPPFVALFSADFAGREPRVSAMRLSHDVSLLALVILAVPVAIQIIALLWHRNCALMQGLALVALGPGVGVVFAAVTGALLGRTVRSRRLAMSLATSVPLLLLVWGGWEFWRSPAIFVFGHFGGWFPGTLYDRGVSITSAYLTFRISTAVLITAVVSLLCLVEAAHRGGFPALRKPTEAHLVLAVSLLVSIVLYAYGPELGYRATVDHIAESLGATWEGERCIVHAPRELDRREVRRVVADCSYRVAAAEQALGVREPDKVRAFLFRTPEEKQRHMGAKRTYIAKPWRREVYLQHRPWPHPVLAHEIVHVVARNAARGPFQVGGSWGGWLPDPALIEGVAVAAAWDVRGGLTPHQWARAMVELDLMPPLDQVFGLSFLGQPPRNAYTVAGSVLRYLLDEHGAGAVASAYRSGDLEGSVGLTMDEIEARWREFLEDVSLPPEAMALAELRFRDTSVLSAVCPHEVARLEGQLAGDLAAGDLVSATQTCESILAIDEEAVKARAQLIGALAWQGEDAAAEAELSQLMSSPTTPRAIVALAHERLANAAWKRGNETRALTMYRALLEGPLAEDRARSLEVRVDALNQGGEQARIVFDLLVGHDGRTPPPALAVHLTRQLRELRADGLGRYLEARQLMFALDYQRALALVAEARRQGLATKRLEREARRMEIQLSVGRFQLDRADRLLREWESTDPAPPEVAQIEDWRNRIQWIRSRSMR